MRRTVCYGVRWGLKVVLHYRKNNLDSLRILAMNIMPSNGAKNLYQFALAKRFLGTFTIRRGNINEGIQFLKEARDAFMKIQAIILLSETEKEIGNAFYLSGNYNKAASYYFASMVHGEKSSDVTAGYNGLIGLGKTVCAIGDTLNGVWFVQKYLDRSLRDSKFEAAADACGYLGMIAGENGQVELMSAYYSRAIIYSDRSNSKTHKANAITNKAIDYFYHNKVDSSILLFRESLKIRKEVGSTRPVVESLYNLAIFHIESEDFEKAKKYAEEGESLSSEKGIRSWQLDCLKLLLEIGMKTNDLENIESIRFNIERIQKELKEMSTLDEEIIDLAVQLTTLHDPQMNRGYFLWESICVILIVLCSGLLMYSYRTNLT